MTGWSALRNALKAIAANRLRSGLTMLGVIIGTGSVILLVAVGNAAQAGVARQLEDLGTNLISVFPGTPSSATGSRVPRLTFEDVRRIEERAAAGGIRAVLPVLSAQGVTLAQSGITTSPGDLLGVPARYQGVSNFRVQSGRLFARADEATRQRVIVLGATIARRLYGRGPAVGRPVTANGARYQVIGVLRRRGAGTGLVSQDTSAVAPLTAVQDTLTGRTANLSFLAVQAVSRETTGRAERTIRRTLRESHNLRPGVRDDFDVFNQESLLQTTSTIIDVIRIVLAGIAAISLVVGGIGVTNIMLVTVTERTREIGIRKAVGARRAQIVGQFLIEAVVLCVVGGAIGVAGALALAAVGTALSGYPATVTPLAVAVAFGVSVGIGLFFGWFPANRAARLKPIDALRYE